MWCWVQVGFKLLLVGCRFSRARQSLASLLPFIGMQAESDRSVHEAGRAGAWYATSV